MKNKRKSLVFSSIRVCFIGGKLSSSDKQERSLNNRHIQDISIKRQLQNLELKTYYKTKLKIIITNIIIIFN